METLGNRIPAYVKIEGRNALELSESEAIEYGYPQICLPSKTIARYENTRLYGLAWGKELEIVNGAPEHDDVWVWAEFARCKKIHFNLDEWNDISDWAVFKQDVILPLAKRGDVELTRVLDGGFCCASPSEKAYRRYVEPIVRCDVPFLEWLAGLRTGPDIKDDFNSQYKGGCYERVEVCEKRVASCRGCRNLLHT
ncbi:MAG: hypothetical protein DRN81_03055 [Thermoproteota archaeon]|nr:MAG: hypothetical protein DRN81_03055 [Candidatus Korarchaeota archaeon]